MSELKEVFKNPEFAKLADSFLESVRYHYVHQLQEKMDKEKILKTASDILRSRYDD